MPEVEKKRQQSAGRVPDALRENRKSASNAQGVWAGSFFVWRAKAGLRDKTQVARRPQPRLRADGPDPGLIVWFPDLRARTGSRDKT
jgi:hypothetical protein